MKKLSQYFFQGLITQYSSAEDKPPQLPIATPAGKASEFINYELTKPEVRIVSAKNILAWVQNASQSTAGK